MEHHARPTAAYVRIALGLAVSTALGGSAGSYAGRSRASAS